MTDNFLRGCLILSYQKCGTACIDVFYVVGLQYYLIILVLCICADFMLMSPHFLHVCCSVKSVIYCVHCVRYICGVGSNWLASVGSLS